MMRGRVLVRQRHWRWLWTYDVRLQFRGERVVMRRRDHAGDQIGDGSADHSGLAEGGEHLIDVMQEG